MFLFGVNRVKKFFLSSLLILSFFSTFGVAQDAKSRQVATLKSAQSGIELPFVSKTLPNGLEVIVLQDSSVPIVTVELAVRNGSFTEPPELNGLSHLYEHMFFKSNEARFVFQCEGALSSGRISAYGRQVCGEKMKFKPLVCRARTALRRKNTLIIITTR
jgi:predicted Zn-dependent peptidase